MEQTRYQVSTIRCIPCYHPDWKVGGGQKPSIGDFCADHNIEETQCRREYLLESPARFQALMLVSILTSNCSARCDTTIRPSTTPVNWGKSPLSSPTKTCYDYKAQTAPVKIRRSTLMIWPTSSKSYGNARRISSIAIIANADCDQTFFPILDRVLLDNHVGICLGCWYNDQHVESWPDNPVRDAWRCSQPVGFWRKDCCEQRELKAMYMAEHRDWTPLSYGQSFVFKTAVQYLPRALSSRNHRCEGASTL